MGSYEGRTEQPDSRLRNFFKTGGKKGSQQLSLACLQTRETVKTAVKEVQSFTETPTPPVMILSSAKIPSFAV